MIRSSLVKSACVAMALLGLSAPQAGAIEIQGSNPTALSDGMISKVVMVHRGVTARGPNGGVYHRGGTAVGGYRGGAYRGGPTMAAERITAAASIAAPGSIAADMAAGRGRAGIAGAPAARLRPALRSASWPPARRSPTQASLQRRAYAGTTPTQAIGRASGTRASRISDFLIQRPFLRRCERATGLRWIERLSWQRSFIGVSDERPCVDLGPSVERVSWRRRAIGKLSQLI